MGLSGWFFEYPIGLMAALFLMFATPLLLILRKSPEAPRWNIIMWRSVSVLITLRSVSIFVEPESEEMTREEVLGLVLTLLPIVAIAVAWTLLWTNYFRKYVPSLTEFSSQFVTDGDLSGEKM